MDPAIGAFLALFAENGPWAIVVYGLWMIGTKRLVLAREYDKVVTDAAAAATKAQQREDDLKEDNVFWRDRYLRQLEIAQTAMGALSAAPSRGQSR